MGSDDGDECVWFLWMAVKSAWQKGRGEFERTRLQEPDIGSSIWKHLCKVSQEDIYCHMQVCSCED